MTPTIRALEQAYRTCPKIAEVIKTKTATVSTEALKAAAYKGPSFSTLSLVTLALSGVACATLFDKTLRCDAAVLKFPQGDWIIHYLQTHPILAAELFYESLPDLYKSIGTLLGDKKGLSEASLRKDLETLWKSNGLSLEKAEDKESFEALLATVIECEDSYRKYPMKHQVRDEERDYNRRFGL